MYDEPKSKKIIEAIASQSTKDKTKAQKAKAITESLHEQQK